MNKLRQRKRSAYDLGRSDALAGLTSRYSRWDHHPQRKAYRAGYTSIKPQQNKKQQSWFMKFIDWVNSKLDAVESNP